jgi:hypothetical protein
MASPDIPPDLIALQRDFDAANVRCEEIAARLPSAIDVAAGRAEFTDEQVAELRDARARRDQIGMKLINHEWWEKQPNRFEARRQLHEVARAEQ